MKRESGEEEVETIEVGEGEGIKGTPDSLTLTSPTLKKEKDIKREKDIKKETVKTEHRDPAHRTKDTKVAESELVRDLKAQLKKAVNEMKEMKLLLDMYKGVGKEQRDKVQLMAAERKTRAELEELRQQIKKIQVCPCRETVSLIILQFSEVGKDLFNDIRIPFRKVNARRGRSWRTRTRS